MSNPVRKLPSIKMADLRQIKAFYEPGRETEWQATSSFRGHPQGSPGTLLAQYVDPLERAARRVLDAFEAIARQRGVSQDTGQAILDLAAEQGCDLVAMGCFGHSQFHQLLLGGASRTVLRDAELTVLMAR